VAARACVERDFRVSRVDAPGHRNLGVRVRSEDRSTRPMTEDENLATWSRSASESFNVDGVMRRPSRKNAVSI
jgi:hypothetical protein